MSSSSPSAPTREELLAASQRRLQARVSTEDEASALRFERERDTRQMFRRLLDPGILRGVEKKTAMSSLKTLLTISENLLSQPHNEKFKQFKPTNPLIKKTLVDVKGALEYAVAVSKLFYQALHNGMTPMSTEIQMGFRAEVQNFQPYYVFNDRKTAELRIGASVLREALDRQAEREERTVRAKQSEQDSAELQAKQVKLAFEDDRKRKALQDKLDRERRIAREIAAAQLAAAGPSSPSTSPNLMPGDGVPLQGGRALLSPPPYQDEEYDSD
ncbi:hypothetical protein JB92DRAFT_2821564 [Gautieria morchelliformis]|nr:hypothetical protein JB92DRAFT_2821564 [Gautieria morchelliformis]